MYVTVCLSSDIQGHVLTSCVTVITLMRLSSLLSELGLLQRCVYVYTICVLIENDLMI